MGKKAAGTVEGVVSNIEGVDTFEGWLETIQDGFPPYWQPQEGRSFHAKPVLFDFRNPEFLRVVFEACSPTDCAKGPQDEQEQVTVQVGEKFTVPLYKAMEDFGYYMNLPIKFTAVSKEPQKGDKKKSFWKFSALMHPDNVKVLESRKLEAAQKAMAERKAAPAELLPAAEG